MVKITVTVFDEPVTIATDSPPEQEIKKLGTLLYREVTEVKTATYRGKVFKGETSLKNARKIRKELEKIMSSSNGPDIDLLLVGLGHGFFDAIGQCGFQGGNGQFDGLVELELFGRSDLF